MDTDKPRHVHQRLRCPLCGLSASAKNFERIQPIELIEIHGLGKGRGFQNLRIDKSHDPEHLAGLIALVQRVLNRLVRRYEVLGGELEIESEEQSFEEVESWQRLRQRGCLVQRLRPRLVAGVASLRAKIRGPVWSNFRPRVSVLRVGSRK